MNVKRFVWLAAVSLLCAGWAHADPFFYIQTTGWNSKQSFTVTGSSTTASTDGFSEGSFCPSDNWYECYCSEDPGTKVNNLGDAMLFNGSAMFTGNTTVDYENVGSNIETLTITTTITGNQLNELYTCSSDIFTFCGFKTFGDPTLEILFTKGDISSAVPEPRQYILLAVAMCACVALDQFRRRRARA